MLAKLIYISVCICKCVFEYVCIYIYLYRSIVGDQNWSSHWFSNKQHYLSVCMYIAWHLLHLSVSFARSLSFSSGSVWSNTAIFPKKERRKREISNESARGLSLRETNVKVSAKGAPHDAQDTVKTLQTIIWYKHACIRQTIATTFCRCPNLLKRTLTKMSL